MPHCIGKSGIGILPRTFFETREALAGNPGQCERLLYMALYKEGGLDIR